MVERVNQNLRGVLHVSTQHAAEKTHMWTSRTLPEYLQFLAGEIRAKRQQLGLDATHKCLVLCDAAGVHGAGALASIRECFEKEANAILLHGGYACNDSRVVIPGGWGACGAPNDAWHQFFHLLRRQYMRMVLGNHKSVALRKSLDELNLSIDGGVRHQLPQEASLMADVWALQNIAQYQNGKILDWAWVSRGLITEQQVADWKFGGDLKAARDHFKQTPGELAKLWQLDNIPDINLEQQNEVADQASVKALPGERRRLYMLNDTPLPLWMRAPLDSAILQWKQQNEQWQEKMVRREGKPLPKAQKAKYDEFMADHRRHLVLDVKKEVAVVNVGSRTLASLKKDCILLTIAMSQEADQLKMYTKTKEYSLRCVEVDIGTNPTMPANVDFFQGAPATFRSVRTLNCEYTYVLRTYVRRCVRMQVYVRTKVRTAVPVCTYLDFCTHVVRRWKA